MEEFCGGYSNLNRGKAEKDGDFQEEDIWAFAAKNREEAEENMQKSSSTPVNIPEYRYKVNNNKKSRRVFLKDGSFVDSSAAATTTSDGVYYGKNIDVINGDNVNAEVDEEEEDYGDGMVPPHEYIARRLARNNQNIASFSMMEGVGRTLKGRDLSKLRNAILTKTGFLE